MENNENKTLSIQSNVLLMEHHLMVKEVIEKETIYDTLALHTDDKSFDETFVQSKNFGEFWEALGESVTTLKLSFVDSLPIKLETYFTKLLELKIVGYDSFKVLSPDFYRINNQLESIVWYNGLPITKEQFEVKFSEILTNSKTLKSFTFDFDFPLEASFVNEYFSNINYDILQVDDIIIDCEPLPHFTDYHNYSWKIKSIEMEFDRTDNCARLVIKPLILQEELIEGKSECEENCTLDHKVFRCESVTKFIFTKAPSNKCRKYYKSCFESFPNVVQIDNFPKSDDGKLDSKLLNDILLFSNDPFKFPSSFPAMDNIIVNLEKKLIKEFKKLLKGSPVPNTLKDKVNEQMDNNVAAESSQETLTPIGLEKMGNGIQKLVTSKEQTEEPSTSWLATFKGIPNHIWEKIFLYLSKNEQLGCRQVCTAWFDIFSSGLKLDRTIKITNNDLLVKRSPIHVFANSTFPYNRLLFAYHVNFGTDENLSKFWETIGKTIVTLEIDNIYTPFTDVFKTGLASHHLPNLKELVFDQYYDLFDVSLSKKDPEWQIILNIIVKVTFRNSFQRHVINDFVDFEFSNIEELKIINTSKTYLNFLNSLFFPKIRKFTLIHDAHMTLHELFETELIFSQLISLSIVKYHKWRMVDFDLIAWNCPNLTRLTIGQDVEPEKPNIVTEAIPGTSKDKTSKPVVIRTFDQDLVESVATMMFEELLDLCDIYFVSFCSTEKKVSECKVYSRSAVSGFSVSEGKSDHPIVRDFFSACESMG